ncbi:MAG: transcriptional regulator NrdR [Syntrophomonadaceae bacterium]|nr:transcriptional regulator NrdR [Syntrophomonadaceae bacterium]
MRCPYCKAEDSKVIDSRSSDEGGAIRRRRQCAACERRFTTYERYEERPLVVVKNEGKRQPFDRHKLSNGIARACNKRSISSETIDAIVSRIEAQLRDQFEREVPSIAIGELVMQELRELDEVAYVRFASVYKHFADPDSFIEAIDQLKTSK